jgi:hypothetical protein
MGDKRLVKFSSLSVLSLALGGGLLASSASAQSLMDRFTGMFGSKPPPPPIVSDDPQPDLNCPPVTIRAGASTYAVAAPGKEAVGNDVRFMVSITKMARECIKAGGEITAHVGIQGRVIAGPAGAPPTVEVPLRIAVVQSGVGEKIIATKAYTTTVNIGEETNVPFSFVADDIVYPAPTGGTGDSYIFYTGFDPQLVQASEPKPKGKKRKQAAPAG